ncbi:MAG: hypothetical protein QXQ54_08090 [Thermoplasmata archaeon]
MHSINECISYIIGGEIIQDVGETQRKLLATIRAMSPKQQFFVAYNYDDKISPWVSFDIATRFPVHHRSVGFFELVFDIDAVAWEQVKTVGMRITETCKRLLISHYAYLTGGKGIHIHVFFRYPMGENLDLDAQVIDMGVLPRDLRIAYFNYILKQAEISPEQLDNALVVWDDTQKGHMVRAEGASRCNGEILTYKSYIAEIPRTRTFITSIKDVKLPEKIEINTLPPIVIKSAIALKKKLEVIPVESIATNSFPCTLGKLPLCIKKLLEGLPEGNRNHGARILVVALKIAGLSYESAFSYCRLYYENCPKHDFKFDEVKAWLDWIWRKPSVYWSCNLPKALRLCEER